MTRTRPRRACMIVHAYYEEDARVRREAETLVAAGWEVDVFGLRRPDDARPRQMTVERLLENRVGPIRLVAVASDGAIYFVTPDAVGRLVPAVR